MIIIVTNLTVVQQLLAKIALDSKNIAVEGMVNVSN